MSESCRSVTPQVEVDILGSRYLTVLIVSVDVKGKIEVSSFIRPRSCVNRGGRPPNNPYCLCGRKATLNFNLGSELRSCVKVEVAVLGSPHLTVFMVSVSGREVTFEEERDRYVYVGPRNQFA